MDPTRFFPAWWCPGPHLQTIWAGLFRPAPRVPVTRAHWELPDGDFLTADVLAAPPSAPRLIIFHGLESSSTAPAVRHLMHQARRRGWCAIAVNFRGCGGEPNRLRRSYHGGDTADVDWVIERIRADSPSTPLFCLGISLGGNVLLKYLGERADAAPPEIRAAAAISAPFDLAASVRALNRGFSRVYQWRLVASLKRKTRMKLERFPDLVDRAALRAARTLGEFDDLVTAPVHGFADAQAYWAASSSAQFLARIRRPTLLINAADDPFLPSDALPWRAAEENPHVTALFPPAGGHVGFLEGAWPAAATAWAETQAIAFLDGHA
jgi:hypothetical protein